MQPPVISRIKGSVDSRTGTGNRLGTWVGNKGTTRDTRDTRGETTDRAGRRLQSEVDGHGGMAEEERSGGH